MDALSSFQGYDVVVQIYFVYKRAPNNINIKVDFRKQVVVAKLLFFFSFLPRTWIKGFTNACMCVCVLVLRTRRKLRIKYGISAVISLCFACLVVIFYDFLVHVFPNKNQLLKV